MPIRNDFPILARKVNGQSLVYLDNAATTQKPQIVITAMNDYYLNSNSNVHRAVHTLAGEATEGYEACRSELKNWFNAERVIITSGTTESINLVAHAWARANLVSGDAVILTEMEHHSDIVPWQLLAQDIGIELRFVSLNDDLTLDLDAFEASLAGAKLVACVHTSNVLGIRNPVEQIIETSHANGVKVLLDSAQAVPHEKIDFKALDADFLACSAHKMCGPTGIGCLLVKEDSFNQMQPFMGGGDMIQTVTTTGSTYQEDEHKFEAGTPRIAEGVGWAAALKWLGEIDLQSEHIRLLEIARWTAIQLKSISGMTVFGRHDDGDSAVVSFIHNNIHPEDMARLLDARGIAIRTGHHCAQPLMRRLGVEGTMRVSFYLYNNQAEAELFIETVKGIVERFS